MYSKSAALAGVPETDPELGKFVGGTPSDRWFWYGGAVVAGGLVAWFVGWQWAIGVLLLGGFIGWTKRSFAIYEQGLRQGNKRIRWDEAEYVTCYSEVTTAMGSRVDRTAFLEINGKGKTIRDVRGSFRLHNVVVKLVAPVLAQRRLKEIEQGVPFVVGSVTVERDGLVYKGTRASFSEGGKTTIASGELICWSTSSLGQSTHAWFRLSTTNRDVHVLAEILRHYRWME